MRVPVATLQELHSSKRMVQPSRLPTTNWLLRCHTFPNLSSFHPVSINSNSQCIDLGFVSLEGSFPLNGALGGAQHRFISARDQDHFLENTTEGRRRLIRLLDRRPLFVSVNKVRSTSVQRPTRFRS
jgi:hypothetical protein